MECFVAGGAVIVFVLAAYFFSRLQSLERKSREIDALKNEVVALRDILSGATLASKIAETAVPIPAVAPPTTPVVTVVPAAQQTPAPVAQSTVSATPALSPTPMPTRASVPVAAAVMAAPTKKSPPPSIGDLLPDGPLMRWFMGSHVVVRLGIIILFIGVAFLLKFVADQGWFSIELRLASAGVLGAALVFAGWRLRLKQRIYGLTLQGGGLGIVYLTTFVAFRIYEFLPTGVAFGLLVAIGITCAVLAVLNDAKALALPAIVGAFAAPLLVPSDGGTHFTLFSYYFLVNCAILLIAWYKSWRELNLVGYLFTVGLASMWGAQYYQRELFSSVEPFLILFFLFYLAIGLLFTIRQPTNLMGPVDGTIVFGTPTVTAAWQFAVAGHIPYAMAWTALGMGLTYLGLFVLLGRASINFAPLRQCYLAIGAILLTMAVPWAVDGQLTSAVWALSGLGMLWLGLRQTRPFFILWGGLVQLGAAFFFVREIVVNYASTFERLDQATWIEGDKWLGLLDSYVGGGVLLAIAALATGYLMLAATRRDKAFLNAFELSVISSGATLWGMAWWYGTGIYAVARYFLPGSDSYVSLALFFILSAVVGEWLGGRFHWKAIRLSSLLLWAVIGSLAFLQFGSAFLASGEGLFFESWGWIVWPAAIVVHYWMLYRLDHLKRLRMYHAIGLWLLTEILIFDQLLREYDFWDSLWDTLVVMAVPWLLVVLISAFGKYLPWPTGKYFRHYMTTGLAPLLALLVLCTFLISFTHDGYVQGYDYMPLLNPVTIASLLIFGALTLWLVQLQRTVEDASSLRWAWIVLATLLFLWINAELARYVYHSTALPFTFDGLFLSSLLQAIYSIVWTILAMTLMVIGTRTTSRFLWLVGAALLGLTVIKLLVLDLSSAETMARIVSFIGVGLLMLLIGYFSPIPPKAGDQKTLAAATPENINP